MISVGIDPGSNKTGYAFLEKTEKRIKVLEYGIIQTKRTDSLPNKLKTIFEKLSELFRIYKPSYLAIETAFVAKYPKAALVLGETRGAIISVGNLFGIEIHEYEPRLIKKTITGVGKATKDQVSFMIQKRLHLKHPPKPSDASDALAIAYCFLVRQLH
ncbi:MAG: crossover junction endodeoxyribonuclease RuvC [Fibrobacteria bacterium]|nr:crossover junction endodeoxyribonuclease RuvC [Fibrobacteria bacterium]